MTSQEILQLRTGITVLRNIAPLLEKAEQVLHQQPAPASPAKKRTTRKTAGQREADLTVRLILGARRP